MVEQAKIQSERELGALERERDGLVRELEYWNEAIRITAPTIRSGDTNSISLEQLANCHENLRKAELRHSEVCEKIQALTAIALTQNDVIQALASFEPLWESLTVREQTRIVQLIIKQIDYDGSTGRVTITFHREGIKSIVLNGHTETAEAAS